MSCLLRVEGGAGVGAAAFVALALFYTCHACQLFAAQTEIMSSRAPYLRML